MFKVAGQDEAHILLRFQTIMKYNYRTGARCFNTSLETSLRRETGCVVVRQYIPHHNLVSHERSHLAPFDASIGWTKQGELASAHEGCAGKSVFLEFHLTLPGVADILINAIVPSIQVMECMITNCVTGAR